MADKELRVAGASDDGEVTIDERRVRTMLKGINDSMNRLEEMVAQAYKLPLADKVVINDNELAHYVDDLRHNLPEVVDQAMAILQQQDEIIEAAEHEADQIVEDAKNYGEKLTNEHEIVKQAKERAKTILQQTQEQEREIMERAQANARQVSDNADNYAMQLRGNADAYAKQVVDQLLQHVGTTFQNVQQAEGGLQQAMQVLQQGRAQLDKQSQAEHVPTPAPQPQAPQE